MTFIIEDDLVKLWRSHPIRVGLRRKTAEGACDGCDAWRACRGGCPAVVHGNTGLTLLQDQDCTRVQHQGIAIQPFGQGLYSAPGPANASESLALLGKKLRDMAYFFALR